MNKINVVFVKMTNILFNGDVLSILVEILITFVDLVFNKIFIFMADVPYAEHSITEKICLIYSIMICENSH